jgi:dephospho-CoA kinase
VSKRLAARGAVIVDADAITRELQEPGQPVLQSIVDHFGVQVLHDDGTLDRAALAEIVFHDTEQLASLNAIVHPAVGAEIAARLERARTTDAVVVLDVPLLVDRSRYPVAAIVVVDVAPEVAVERLVAYRGFTRDDAWARVRNQPSRQERLDRADRVIDNSGPLEALNEQLDELWTWMLTLPPDQSDNIAHAEATIDSARTGGN